jgi:hypothetical protein
MIAPEAIIVDPQALVVLVLVMPELFIEVLIRTELSQDGRGI